MGFFFWLGKGKSDKTIHWYVFVVVSLCVRRKKTQVSKTSVGPEKPVVFKHEIDFVHHCLRIIVQPLRKEETKIKWVRFSKFNLDKSYATDLNFTNYLKKKKRTIQNKIEKKNPPWLLT